MEMIERIITSIQHSVSISDPSSVGGCRRLAMRMAEERNFDTTQIGRIGIIATEVATNIQRHGGGGTVFLQVFNDDDRAQLEVLGIDKGPGMQDVDKCMRDGYSTGGTAGTGLGAVRRLSSEFDLFSAPAQGTVLMSRTVRQARPMGGASAFELGAISIPVAGEIECGDKWCAAENGSMISMTIADGLGHGTFAAAASTAAMTAFRAQPFERPDSIMQAMHRATCGTRGAAAACALSNVENSKIAYAGVGNIYGAVVTDERSHGMVSHNGTLGMQPRRMQQFDYAWPPHSYVVMHSDGLSARWNISSYPGLNRRHPAVVAGVLFRDFGRPRDDASVLVARYRP